MQMTTPPYNNNYVIIFLLYCLLLPLSLLLFFKMFKMLVNVDGSIAQCKSNSTSRIQSIAKMGEFIAFSA